MATATEVFGIWALYMLWTAVVLSLPVLFRAVRSSLPSSRLQELLVALEELDDLFNHSLESGYMTDLAITTIRGQVLALHARTDVLQFRTMGAPTSTADFKNAFRGLSGEISAVIRDVKALRAKISAMSLDELVAQQRQQALPSHLNKSTDSKGTQVPAYTYVPLVVAEHILPERKTEENKEAVDAA